MVNQNKCICKDAAKVHSSEHGRSLVEMLGVLAVIGVLSVLALIGYQIAIVKHRANLLAEEVNDISQIIALDLIRANVKSLLLQPPYDRGKLMRTKYTLSYGCRGSTEASTSCLGVSSYYIEIQRVPYRVCREAAPLIRYLRNTETMYINGIENGHCSKTSKNTFLSVFSLEGQLSGGVSIPKEPIDSDKSCQSAEECGSTSGMKTPCVNGQCVGCTDDSQCWLAQVCNKEAGICENPANKCESDEQCVQKDPNKPYCSPAGNCVKCYQDEQCRADQICGTESASCFVEKVQNGHCFNASVKTFSVDGVSYAYFPGNQGSWWDARRWCRSVGRRMVSFADLGCEDISTGKCLDKNGQVPHKLAAIEKKIGTSNSSYVSDRKTACLAYHVNFSNGKITSRQRINGGSALCQ